MIKTKTSIIEGIVNGVTLGIVLGTCVWIAIYYVGIYDNYALSAYILSVVYHTIKHNKEVLKTSLLQFGIFTFMFGTFLIINDVLVGETTTLYIEFQKAFMLFGFNPFVYFPLLFALYSFYSLFKKDIK